MLTSFAFTLVLLASPPSEGSAKTNLSAWDHGRLQLSGEWKSVREATSEANAEYVARQEKCPNTALGHLKLAQWCRTKHLTEEAYAHLRTAERLEPNSAEVQRAMGRTLRDGLWATAAEQRARRELKERILEADRRWAKTLSLFPQKLEKLPEINDPYAIPALETVISKKSEAGGRLAVAAIERISHVAATRSLARHAVFSDFESVRRGAVKALRNRSPDLVVPTLIRWLDKGEWSALGEAGFGGLVWSDVDNTIVCTPLAFNNGAGRGDVADFVFSVRNPELRGLWVNNQRYRATWQEVRRTSMEKVAENGRVIERLVDSRADHALAALKDLTGREADSDMSEWSKWWAQVNFQIQDETVEETAPTRETTIVEGMSIRLRQMSCFAAGTPVWTRHGLVPIDHVRPGDLVLSRSSNTGELAYKPVVHRTLRPRTQTRMVEASGEKIQTTLGHPFFVAGSGWTKANDLTAKQTLVTVDGTTPIGSISEGSVVQAYNLEVSDFASYFVGKTGVLVHDNTPIRDEPRTMPGVAAAK